MLELDFRSTRNIPVPRRDAEAEDVADLGVDDGVPGLRGAGDDGLDAAADEPGHLRAACCLSGSNTRFGQQAAKHSILISRTRGHENETRPPRNTGEGWEEGGRGQVVG
jgi:hypothetical protein